MKSLTTELKWAFIFTVVALLWMVLEKLVGLHDEHIKYHMYLTNLFAIPAIIIIVLALKDKKQKDYNGRMTYKQGLISGIILSIFISMLSPLAQWVTTYIITPEYFPNVIAHAVETEYFEDRAAAEAYFNYENYAIQGAIFAFIMGVITTAITMLFIKSKN